MTAPKVKEWFERPRFSVVDLAIISLSIIAAIVLRALGVCP